MCGGHAVEELELQLAMSTIANARTTLADATKLTFGRSKFEIPQCFGDGEGRLHHGHTLSRAATDAGRKGDEGAAHGHEALPILLLRQRRVRQPTLRHKLERVGEVGLVVMKAVWAHANLGSFWYMLPVDDNTTTFNSWLLSPLHFGSHLPPQRTAGWRRHT